MEQLKERHARPRWHRLYYLLAAFDVLTVVLSLFVSHQIRGISANSVAVNQVWGQRLSDFSDLGQLAQARELAQRTVREARWLIAGLRPTARDDFGLAAAIRLELDTLRTEGWHVTYAEELGTRRLPTETETALFRVALLVEVPVGVAT